MRRLLIDDNIVLDLLAHREFFYLEAADLFSRADLGNLKLTISSLSFANTNYILSKQKSPKEARAILRKFKVLIEILSLNEKTIELALSDDNFPDFEDGLKYYTALENQVDVIITRDKKGFKNAKIPVLTAKEFLVSDKF
jgi:predicted nucleic acid-binding protein